MQTPQPDKIIRFVLDEDDLGSNYDNYSFKVCVSKYYGAVEGFVQDIMLTQLMMAESTFAANGEISLVSYCNKVDNDICNTIYDRIESLYETEESDEDDAYASKLSAAIANDGDILYDGAQTINQALMRLIEPDKIVEQLYVNDNELLEAIDVNVYRIGNEDNPSLTVDIGIFIEK